MTKNNPVADTQLEQVKEEETKPNQNRKNSSSLKSGKKWLVWGSILFIGGAGTVSWFFWQNRQAATSAGVSNTMPPVPVTLSTLETEQIKTSTDVLGTLEASQTVNLQSEIEGRLVDILVREGQNVNRGEVLFALESDSLQAQLDSAQATLASRQAQLAELEAGSRPEEIASAQARLNRAKIRLANAKRGSSQEEIAQAQAQLDSAQAQNELAQQRLNRYRNLRDEGAISSDQFDTFVTEAKTASANLEQAQRRLNQLQEGTQSDVRALQAEVEEAEQNLLLLQNGARQEDIDQARASVQEAQANVRRLKVELDKTMIKAPIAGKISNIPVKVGDFIETDTTLTSITQNDLLELNISVPLEKAPELELGLPVEVLNSQEEVIAVGKIDFISPNVTSDSQLVLAKAFFSNDVQNKLLNRQFIPARIVWDSSQGILVPSSAIFRIGGQGFVFVAEQNPEGEGLIAKQRPIKIGEIHSNSYEVLEGLQAGEKIISAGILKVQEGSPIQEMPENETKPINSSN
ncbi:efflux RND transporter periplasmic adaptor subunit [Cyanobacterium aponinum FACHB-4101]|uniref:efflux RND transporter periplasmic adaptor subunit n=1 Tax=Cyanobacterium aponinum TaxID=379064 RepID=UPI0016805371|nr:efflux RND transporter periplasmic adaptor subunit [Cyanobacterium aponinum FACHB-4101]